MYVNHRYVSLARPGSHLLKNEFLRSWDLQKSQIFRRRADEDQIVVLDIIQGKQRSALYPKLAVEHAKDPVQLVDRQHLTHSSVMIEDRLPRIGGRVVVPHVRLRTSHKVGVAENNPRRLGSGHKAAPENLIGGRNSLARGGLHVQALRQKYGARRQRSGLPS